MCGSVPISFSHKDTSYIRLKSIDLTSFLHIYLSVETLAPPIVWIFLLLGFPVSLATLKMALSLKVIGSFEPLILEGLMEIPLPGIPLGIRI